MNTVIVVDKNIPDTTIATESADPNEPILYCIHPDMNPSWPLDKNIRRLILIDMSFSQFQARSPSLFKYLLQTITKHKDWRLDILEESWSQKSPRDVANKMTELGLPLPLNILKGGVPTHRNE